MESTVGSVVSPNGLFGGPSIVGLRFCRLPPENPATDIFFLIFQEAQVQESHDELKAPNSHFHPNNPKPTLTPNHKTLKLNP